VSVEQESASLTHRRDGRSPEEFGRAIKYTTLRENRLMRAWADRQPGVRGWERLGPGGDGEVCQKVDGSADFQVLAEGVPGLPDGLVVTELKYIRCLGKATFKKENLDHYIVTDAHVLLIWGHGDEGPVCWAIATPEKLRQIRDEIKPRNDHNGTGGKPAYRVWKSDFSRYFTKIRPWIGGV
jgi:hypothetical protein